MKQYHWFPKLLSALSRHSSVSSVYHQSQPTHLSEFICLSVITDLMILPVVCTCQYHTHMHAQGCTHSHICIKNFLWSFTHKIRFSFRPTISTLFNKRHLINYGRCHIIIILPRVLYSESVLILMMGFSSLCALRHRGREAFPDYLGIW